MPTAGFFLLVICVAAVAVVVESRRKAAVIAELRRRVEKAERLLKQRTALANEVAHEIKNPITAILCSAEALDLLIGGSLEEIHRKSLRYIKEYGDQLLSLVSDFLDISRVEAGMVQPRPTEILIVDTLEPVLGLLEANAVRKRITVKNLVTDRSLKAVVDPKHFKQIIFNLLHNAIKFIPEGGEVHVTVKSAFPEKFVRVSVSDNGPGVPPERLETLFDIHRRVENHRNEGEAGAGLGLALCRSLVELSGGEISARSPRSGGMVIEFTVPSGDETETNQFDTVEPLPARSSLPLYGQTFLIVDDDAGARDSISRLIEAWGGMVDCVTEAGDAMRALAERDYDAVMIDTTGDGLRPHEVAKLLKGDFSDRETTIIVAARSNDDVAAARECGADSVVEKPLNGERLLKSLLTAQRPPVSH